MITTSVAADRLSRIIDLGCRIDLARAETRAERGQGHPFTDWGPSDTRAMREERDDLRASLAEAGYDPDLSENLGRLVSMTDRAAALEALL